MSDRNSAAISPTAHYTGEVWRRNGLSDPALGTIEGRVLHTAAQPLIFVSKLLGGPTLEDFLLARHKLIDRLLDQAIDSGEIGQVIEIAAGMSPRGVRMTRRHPGLTYIEADLPGMARKKRAALEQAGATHRVADLDALADDGPMSLVTLAGELDPAVGTAMVTEGLLNYFPRDAVDGIWARIAGQLCGFSSGLYLSDLHLGDENSDALSRGFLAGLGVFVRGKVHMPYANEADARSALLAAGFETIDLHRGSEIHPGRGSYRVRVVEARTGVPG